MRGGLLIKLLAWGIAISLIALPVVGVLSGRFAADRWPLRTLKVKAEFEHVNSEQIRTAVATQSQRGFFALDLEQVRSAVAALPWVSRVEASKRWPDTLELTVYEQLPFARWGDTRLVSQDGEIFTIPGIAAVQGLPQLSGPDDRLAEVLEFYSRCQRNFSGTGLVVNEVRLSGRGGWQLVLASGVLIDIGSENVDARLRRFLGIWPRLAAGRAPPAAVDLRYENGFSVRWSEIQLPVPAPAGAATATPVNRV